MVWEDFHCRRCQALVIVGIGGVRGGGGGPHTASWRLPGESGRATGVGPAGGPARDRVTRRRHRPGPSGPRACRYGGAVPRARGACDEEDTRDAGHPEARVGRLRKPGLDDPWRRERPGGDDSDRRSGCRREPPVEGRRGTGDERRGEPRRYGHLAGRIRPAWRRLRHPGGGRGRAPVSRPAAASRPWVRKTSRASRSGARPPRTPRGRGRSWPAPRSSRVSPRTPSSASSAPSTAE